MVVFVGLLVLIGFKVEKLGDCFQVVLLLLVWGCQVVNGYGVEYVLCYVVMFIGLYVMKQGFGDVLINQCFNGGDVGMFLGYMVMVVFGVLVFLQECVMISILVCIVVIVVVGFIGVSCMDVGVYIIWQVLFGVFWGLVCDRVLCYYVLIC